MFKSHDEAADRLARKLAARLRLINILWIILSLTLLGSVIGAVAAVYNLYAIYRRWNLPKLIAARHPMAVAMYDGVEGSFLTWGAINVVLGGVVGAGLIAAEYFLIGQPIVKNQSLFTHTMPRGAL